MTRKVFRSSSALVRAMLFAATVASTSTALAQGKTLTQKPVDELPSFDVVSIKPYQAPPPIAPGMSIARLANCRYLTDRVLCTMTPLELIEDAFQLRKMEIAAPSSSGDNVFTLTATMPPGTDKETAHRMLQHVLIERFQLEFHYEPREIPVYALVPGKNGVKLQPAESLEERMKHATTIAGPGGLKATSSGVIRAGVFLADAGTVDNLARNMSHQLDLPVIDKTGLTGQYKFDVRWEPSDDPQFRGRFLSDPEFLAALQEQAGLRIERQRLQVKVLVVDHVGHASSEN